MRYRSNKIIKIIIIIKDKFHSSVSFFLQPRSQGLFPGLGAGQGKGPGNEVALPSLPVNFIVNPVTRVTAGVKGSVVKKSF